MEIIRNSMKGFILLITLLFSHAISAQIITIDDAQIDSIRIMNTKNILTPYDISCSQYESLPHSSILLKRGDSRLYRLTAIINELKEKPIKYLNVRSKVFIYSGSEEKQRLGADNRAVLTNGILYSASNELISFIDSLTVDMSQIPGKQIDIDETDFIIEGREKLNNRIEHLYRKYMRSDSSNVYGILMLVCSANANGQTKSVVIKTKNCKFSKDKSRKLERYIKKHVQWNKNIDRSPTDQLPIMYKLEF